MKPKGKIARIIACLLSSVILMVFAPPGKAGDLEPSGPPAPTMKTLDEVEPRIPIQSLSGSVVAMYIIDKPGSYYFTSDVNIVATNQIGIIVDVNDVTIDLAGYSLIGPGSGTQSGIYMESLSNVEIRNGTVRDFGHYGIYGQMTTSKGLRIIGIRSLSNGREGIMLLGCGHLVKDCTAMENGQDVVGTGIAVRNGSTVTGNTVYNNNGHGIQVSDGCTVTGNTCYSNQIYGIDATNGCTVTGNTVYNNQGLGISTSYASTVMSNTVYNNNDIGIRVGMGSTITGNTVYNNNKDGIFGDQGSVVTGNTVNNNNQSDTADSGGINVRGNCLVKGNTVNGNLQNNIYVLSVFTPGNIIEENLVTGSTNGIYFGFNGNFYANNRASGNGTDYANTAGQTDGGGNVSF